MIPIVESCNHDKAEQLVEVTYANIGGYGFC